MAAMYEQAVLTIEDPAGFQSVHQAIAACFSPAQAGRFLKSLGRHHLRIRHFEAVLRAGLLGSSTQAAYDHLGNADQGQIREFYLASLEQVAPELRQKFFKLYAYY